MLGALRYCCHVPATSPQWVLTGHRGPLTSLGGGTKPCPHGAPASLLSKEGRREGGGEEAVAGEGLLAPGGVAQRAEPPVG